jgi:hypothetical protein
MHSTMKRALQISLSVSMLLVSQIASAQTSDEITFQRTFLLRNVSGTAFNPGPTPHHPLLFTSGDWTSFFEGAASATYVNESGPTIPHQRTTFSTNWLAAGAQRSIGRRGLVLFRVRGSLEPFTVPKEGYPQLLQSISADAGGPLLDRMRAQSVIGEAAMDAALRLTTTSFVHIYAGAVGDPALGGVPYAQRITSEEFVEAPFAYDVQETAHEATRVVTAGIGGTIATLEGSVFHHSVTRGRHSSIEDGGIDSWSGRLVLTPTRNVSIQVSQGSLGDSKRRVTNASATFATDRVASTAIWSKRESDLTPLTLSSFAFELLMRARRNAFMGRVERVDDPLSPNQAAFANPRTHLTFGYLFDFLAGRGYRAGLGINLDYHNSYRTLPAYYGHKPQSVYAFFRVRTDAARR